MRLFGRSIQLRSRFSNCTEDLDMAKEWGVGKGQDGYANCYELECDGLRILDLITVVVSKEIVS